MIRKLKKTDTGNRQNVEQGEDEQGKYYKVYYKEDE